MTAVLLLAVGIDYKVFGTSKRVNAARTSGQINFSPTQFPAMDAAVFAQIREHDEYRVLIDFDGPLNLDLRHYPGLRTPQGFDPLFTSQYRQVLVDNAQLHWWEFEVAPDKRDLLQTLSVRYFISSESSPFYAQYRASQDFQQMRGDLGYYKVFEYRAAQPSFGWDATPGTVERTRWTPEIREFAVQSAAGGRFTLHEQFWPGWQAFIDGREAPVERWREAFQAVGVPSGAHRVLFRFRSRGLRWGAWVSFASVVALLAVLLRRRHEPA